MAMDMPARLMALDQWIESDTERLYGAVSVGYILLFGILERQTKQVMQDVKLYRVPADLDELMRILIAILTG